jgi:hypothetical protein
MAAMKVTTSAAMRARDVSRPHAQHLAFAETAEASAASSRPAAPAVPAVPGDAAVPVDAARVDVARMDAAGANAAPGDGVLGAVKGRGGRRRWRPRGSGRGRASSR